MQTQQYLQQQNFGRIGIRREEGSAWERRVALTPKDVQRLKNITPAIVVMVQPSKLRIFKDKDYEDAGAIISEDLSTCHLIIGVREAKPESLMNNKIYMFFSHSLKGQNNMQLIQSLLQKQIAFIDYEKIVDDNNKRLVYFGERITGTIDFLSGLGNLFLKRGYSTPLLHLGLAYKQLNILEAKESVSFIAKKLRKQGIPQDLCPLIFAITGNGTTARGVYEILNMLPIKIVDPDDLSKILQNKNDPIHTQNIYVTNILARHMVENKNASKVFNKEEYYNFPQEFQPIFHKKYLPYISVIFNCHYWDRSFPRLITDQQIETLVKQGNSRLIGVCDISCDLQGSIEFLKKYTSIENHFYTYCPVEKIIIDEINPDYPNKLLYMAIDNLASETSYDASEWFSQKLFRFIENISFCDIQVSEEKLNLMPEIRKALITYQGNFTKNYTYLQNIKEIYDSVEIVKSTKPKNIKKMGFSLEGNFFGTMGIMEVVKILQKKNIFFEFEGWNIDNYKQANSKVTILVYFDTDKKNVDCTEIVSNIKTICLEKNIKVWQFEQI